MQTQAGTDLVALVTDNPVTVLTDEAKYTEFYERVKAEIGKHVPDVTTDKGRKEIASLAYRVVRSKTAIDAAGKKLNEEARAQINRVDAQRRRIRDELDQLAADVRKPLTEWEDAEKRRQEAIENIFATVKRVVVVTVEDTSETVAARMAELDAIEVDPEVLGDRWADANSAIGEAWKSLSAAKERLEKQEADQRELARLRAEQEERERIEREAAEKAEAERLAKERAEREAAEAKAREAEAAERARAEEKRRADEAIAKAEAEKQAAIEEAERKERERKDAEERARREEESRKADEAHRRSIIEAAAEAIAALGIAHVDDARRTVEAIADGKVPHVTIRF